MMLGIAGFIMIGVIVYCLISSKLNAIPIFVAFPIIVALACGFDPVSIFGFIKKGVTTTMSTAVLFLFSIVYFAVMDDVGMFDPLMDFLVKKAGNNIVMVTVVTAIIATLAHLDGTTASTVLITVPAMLPLYKKLHMRPVVICAIISAAISIMNLVPWGGPVARTAVILKADAADLWHELIPLQGVGLVLVIVFAVYLGLLEKKRGAGLVPTGKAAELSEEMGDVEGQEVDLSLKRPKLVIVNWLITLGVILLMCFTKIPLYGAFMIGLAAALIINFRSAKEQADAVKRHAAAALLTPMILLTTGIFLGILNGTKMMGAMANIMVNIMPAALGPRLATVMGCLSVPFGMMLGTDSFFFGFMPLCIGVAEKFGVAAHDIAMSMLIGKDFCIMVTPHNATTFLLCGMAGVSIKDQLKFSTGYLWLLSVITIFIGGIIGVFKF